MTVALDCRELPAGAAGDRSYLLGLLAGLAELGATDRFPLCYAAGQPTGLGDSRLPAGASVHTIASPHGALWTPWSWPRWARRAGADVLLAQHLVPRRAPCPTVLTLHDVSFMPHPEWFPPRAVRVMRTLIPRAARAATRIVTGSHHAAGEIARWMGVPAERIEVMPYAADPRFGSQDRAAARAAVQSACGLTRPYVLAVGLVQPRKNLPRLLEAMATVVAEHDVDLALAGRMGWGEPAVREGLARWGLAERAHLLGEVPDNVLPALYGAAEALCYPSLYEGFGLPTLEAMACGCPVVCSEATSLPEVVGDAGLLVDPTDPAAIADALARVLDEPGLADDLRARGAERAAGFSWRRCAEQHLALFGRLAGGA